MIAADPAFWVGVLTGATVVLGLAVPVQAYTHYLIGKARRELAASRSIALSAVPFVLQIAAPPGMRVVAIEPPPPPSRDKPS